MRGWKKDQSQSWIWDNKTLLFYEKTLQREYIADSKIAEHSEEENTEKKRDKLRKNIDQPKQVIDPSRSRRGCSRIIEANLTRKIR